ncbi:MAG: sigma-70 family RNA polymerase sigma factor [Planctomycetota bacterium]|nr:MAG: sigma-70 family RNA polymerase sigma factor [Planctomycetota bacterium]
MEKGSSSEEDLEKVEAVLQGDERAFQDLFEKYREKVFHIAYKYLQNREDALDVVQEVFFKVYASLPKFQKKSSFYTWLCRIAINRAIDYSRAKKSNLSFEQCIADGYGFSSLTAKSSKPLDKMANKEWEEHFYQALNKLPHIHRSVFVLYSLNDLSYKEIAQILDCSIGTVMSRLYYARKKLQELLKNHRKENTEEI